MEGEVFQFSHSGGSFYHTFLYYCNCAFLSNSLALFNKNSCHLEMTASFTTHMCLAFFILETFFPFPISLLCLTFYFFFLTVCCCFAGSGILPNLRGGSSFCTLFGTVSSLLSSSLPHLLSSLHMHAASSFPATCLLWPSLDLRDLTDGNGNSIPNNGMTMLTSHLETSETGFWDTWNSPRHRQMGIM